MGVGVLADWQIQLGVKIEPFHDGSEVPGKISYGLSSYGYDFRLGYKYKIFTNALNAILDPKNLSLDSFIDYEGDVCVIPPNSFALAESLEYVEIPRDIMCIVLGKSSYARVGININCTPLEPAWRGKITIEISNSTPLPARVYSGEGIMQVLFFRGDAACRQDYGQKNGRYQDQAGITLPFVKT